MDPGASSHAGQRLSGFEDLMRMASVPALAATALHGDLLAAGAVHVRELEPNDWERLPAWAALKLLERRRVLAALAHIAPAP